MDKKSVITPEETMEAFREAQEAFAGAADELGLKDEEDAVKMVKEFRKEE